MPAGTYVSSTLTNYVQGLYPNAGNPGLISIARFLAPTVIVPGAEGSYQTFGVRAGFQTYPTERAVGGTGNSINVEEGLENYSLTPHALTVSVDEHEKARQMGYGGGAVDRLVRNRLRTLTSVTANSRALNTVAMARAALPAVSAPTGVGTLWGSGTNRDPIKDIDAQMQDIYETFGVLPNRVLMTLGAWAKFKNNAEVLKRFPGSSKNGITVGQMQGLFLNPEARIEIAVHSIDAARLGATDAGKTNILDNETGSDVYVFYAEDGNLSEMDPSFMKTFTMSSNPLGRVRLDHPNVHTDRYTVDWTDATYVTTPEAGRRINVVS